MAMGPPLTDTSKPRHPLAGRGRREPLPTNSNAPGPDRALLHLTIKPTEGETHFIVEGLTDKVITVAINTLVAVTDAWVDAVGHPTARRDRIQEKGDALTGELMDQLVQLTGLAELPVPGIWLKVTDCTVLDHTRDTAHPVSRTPGWEGYCDQNADAHTGDVDGHPIGTRRPFQTLHPQHQLGPGTLAGTQNGYALDSGCPGHRHHTPHHVARPGPQSGGLCAQAWDDADTTLDLMAHARGTDYEDLHCQPANPRKQDAGHAPAVGRSRTGIQHLSRSQRSQASPAASARAGAAQAKAPTGGRGSTGAMTKRPELAQKIAAPPPDPKRKPQTCPYLTPDKRKAMHPEYLHWAEVQGVYVCLLTGQPRTRVWFQGTVEHRMATPGKLGDLQLKMAWPPLPEWGEKATTSNPECPLQVRTPESQVAPRTVWTGDIPEAWLEEPDIPEEQRVGNALAHKLRLRQ